MFIFGDTLINMKTENRWKKKFVYNVKVLKKILAQPKGKKKNLTQTKLLWNPSPLPLKNKMVHSLRQEI